MQDHIPINTMTMTMKYIYLNPTLYIQWRVNIACKVPITVKGDHTSCSTFKSNTKNYFQYNNMHYRIT